MDRWGAGEDRQPALRGTTPDIGTVTDEGARFLDGARRLLDDCAEAVADLERGQREPQGRLRFSAPMALGTLHLDRLMMDTRPAPRGLAALRGGITLLPEIAPPPAQALGLGAARVPALPVGRGCSTEAQQGQRRRGGGGPCPLPSQQRAGVAGWHSWCACCRHGLAPVKRSG